MIILVNGINDDQCISGLKDVLAKVQELEATIKNLLPKETMEEVLYEEFKRYMEEGKQNNTTIKGVFEGSIIKADPNLALPSYVQINWFNFIENPKTSPPDRTNLWSMLTTSQVVTNNSFKIELDTTVEEMNQNITLNSKIYEGLLEDGIDITDFRLAMGIISGHYEGVVQENIYDSDFWQNLVQGPTNEMALADTYAVFYKYDYKRTDLWKKIDIPDCNWIHHIPEGFSCAKATTVDFEECNRRGRKRDGFVQIPCNQLILKVTKDRCNQQILHKYQLVENWDRPQCLIDFKYN